MPKELTITPIPSEHRPPDKRFLKLEHHKYLFPPPFVCRVQGMIGAGKSAFLWTMLSDLYKNYWDEVVIFCGTKDSAHHWEKVPQRSVCLLHDWDPAAFMEYLKQLETDQMDRIAKGKQPLRICIAFDDMIATGIEKPFNKKRSPLEHLILICRHLNVSIILLTQDSKVGMTPAMRNNCMYHVLYRVQTADLAKVAEEHSNELTPKEFERMYHNVMSKGKHEFLIIDYKAAPERRFRYGFTKIIKPLHDSEEHAPRDEEAPRNPSASSDDRLSILSK